MALINCKECGREISGQVKKCVHCGYENVVTPSAPPKGGCLKFIGVVVLFVVFFGIYMAIVHKGANMEMQHIENQVAADMVKQYEIAKKNGNAMDAYTYAGLVSTAYLQAKDEANYKKWKEIERQEAKNAGLPVEMMK